MMIRYWATLIVMLVAACAQVPAPSPPPPPPPPPPPMMIEPPPPPPVVVPGVMVPPPPEGVPLEGGAALEAFDNAQRPLRTSTRSTGPRRSVAASAGPGLASTGSVTVSQRASLSAGALPAVAEDAAALGVEKGVAAFVTPPPMKVTVPTTIKFIAGPSQQALAAQNQGALEESVDIYIGKGMQVVLYPNSSFKITPLSDARQLTLTDKTAVWSWEVTPLNDKSDKLIAQVKVYAVNPDGSFGVEKDSYERDVRVKIEVDKVQQFSDMADKGSKVANSLTGLMGSWQKTIGALVALLGAIGLLAWKLGLRKAKPAE